VGTGSSLEVEQPGHGVDHPLPYRAKVKEIELYICCLSGPSWAFLGYTLLLACDR